MKDIIKNILDDINIKAQDKGTYCDFSSELYKPSRFAGKNFHNIEGDGDSSIRIAFIDGGNNEIISSPDFSLHMIRIYEVIYRNNKRQSSNKYEFYCLASAYRDGDKIFYNVKTYPVNYDIKIGSFDSFDKTLMTGSHRVAVSKICESARKLAEFDIASRLAESMDKEDIIVMDGDLLASKTYEKGFFSKLYSKAEERGIAVCGLSKTTHLFTETGVSLVSALRSMAPDYAWYYYPIAENNNPAHPADIYIVKLHKSSGYCFKLEVYNKIRYSINKIACLLKANSTDPVFPGYPYGLIEADRLARVSNSETEYIRMKIKSAAGKVWKDIEKSIHAVDAHSVLDNIG